MSWGKGIVIFSVKPVGFFNQIILSWKTAVFNRHLFRRCLGIGKGFLVKAEKTKAKNSFVSGALS